MEEKGKDRETNREIEKIDRKIWTENKEGLNNNFKLGQRTVLLLGSSDSEGISHLQHGIFDRGRLNYSVTW